MNKIYGVKTPTKKQLKLLEEQRKNWIEIAKKNDSSYDKTEPFYIQIWVDGDDTLEDSCRLGGCATGDYIKTNPRKNPDNFKTLDIKDFPTVDNKHPRQCDCCGKGMSEGFLIWEDTYACNQNCFMQILYDSEEYMYTEWYHEDIDISSGECVYDTPGNSYYGTEYLGIE